MGHPDKGKGGIIEYPEFLRFVIRNLYPLPFETSIDNYELSDSDNFSGNQTKIARPKEKRKIYSNYTPHRENPPLRKRSTDRSKKISFSPLPLSLSLSKKKERSKAGNGGGWAPVEEEGGGPGGYSRDRWSKPTEPNPTQPFPSEVDEKCVIFINCTFINFHRPNEREWGGGRAVGTKSGYTHARHVG